jgi:hypothetical protein
MSSMHDRLVTHPGVTAAEAEKLGQSILAMAGDVVEHAIEMSGGSMAVRPGDPELEQVYPLAQWIPHKQEFGGKVYRRRIIVVEDWTEVPRAR